MHPTASPSSTRHNDIMGLELERGRRERERDKIGEASRDVRTDKRGACVERIKKKEVRKTVGEMRKR